MTEVAITGEQQLAANVAFETEQSSPKRRRIGRDWEAKKAYDAAWYQRNKERIADKLRKDREENPEKWREKSRAGRARNPELTRARAKAQWQREPDRVRARVAVYSAIKRGKLTRGPCEECGTTQFVQAHHDDYTRPLDVRWLCAKHHKRLHMREQQNGH